MSADDFIIRGRRVVTPNGVRAASVRVARGAIVEVSSYDDASEDSLVVELSEESVLSPGLVDSHVHVNEPGRAHWEGFETATRAAAAGGVTTIIDMPLNCIPPTTTLENLEAKLEAARGKCSVDVAFWGGVVPENLEELRSLHDAGVVGFKCFMIPSGVEEFPHVGEEELRRAMRELASLNATLIAHAERPGPVEHALREHAEVKWGDPRRYENFLSSRPRAAENEAAELLVKLCRETGTRTHIVHHSSSDALPLLAEAKEEGLPLTAETCPHYLAFASEEIPAGATEFKCCPPVRERDNREKLWEALRAGAIDMIVSDHSPCPPEMKLKEEGDFMKAWGGIASLQLRLAVVWTEAAPRGFTFEDMARLLAYEPARLARLSSRKGAIAEGFDADFCVWLPDEEFVVEAEMIEHRHKLTPYLGRRLKGAVEATYLRGVKIYERGKVAVERKGRLIKRGGEDYGIR